MKIISKRKDYYDSAAGLGIDTTIHYLRESLKLDIPHVGAWDAKQEFFFYSDSVYRKWKIEGKIIGFCGLLVPVIIAEIDNATLKPQRLVFYDSASYDKWMEEENKIEKPASRRYHWKDEDSESFFKQVRRNDKWFLKSEAPVFLMESGGRKSSFLQTNINLSELEFYRIKDAYTAFQEISMYLTNQLVKEKEVDEIADKYRIAGHGFDKNSFRNPVKLKDLKD